MRRLRTAPPPCTGPFEPMTFETVNLLLRAGADVNIASRYGVTALGLAAENGNASMVERLLQAGADPRLATSSEGQTVLMTAALAGNAAIVKLLLAHGADPNARESWLGQTALMWAAAENHASVVEALLDAGGRPVCLVETLRGP